MAKYTIIKNPKCDMLEWVAFKNHRNHLTWDDAVEKTFSEISVEDCELKLRNLLFQRNNGNMMEIIKEIEI